MKRTNIDTVNNVNCCEGCSRQTCLRSLTYPLYVFGVTLFLPLFLYVTVIPQSWTANIYWLGFCFILFTNIIIIVEALFNIISATYHYCRKKRHYVWNAQLGRYQLMYETDYTNLAKANSNILITPYLINEAIEKQRKQDEDNVYSVEIADSTVPELNDRKIDDLIIKTRDPSLAIIVPAYLVNEKDIIYDTLRHMGTINYSNNANVNIILTFNSPPFNEKEMVLARIDDLQETYKKCGKTLTIVEVPKSRSKAENINYVIDLIEEGKIDKPDFVAIYDADHLPEQNSIIRAVHLMQKKNADVLQGRCVVYNNKSFLGSIIATEFDMIYIIHHKGGELVRGMGFFGGSNGVWRYHALKTVRMDHTMLTEDIDSSMRAIINHGFKFIYSNSVVSYELCPTTLISLIKQRIRWSQGWFQVTLRHTWPMLKCNYLTCRNKFTFFIMLLYREIFYYPASQVIPLFITSVIRNTYEQNEYLLLSTIFSILILPLELIVVNLNKRLDSEHITPSDYKDVSIWQQLIFIMLAPAYDYLKFFIVVVSHILELCGNKVWRVTSRT
jgi:cellulose synthase/poly-beta-1,6-N-acetylglucosamine synthase-like glycosyltransferase